MNYKDKGKTAKFPKQSSGRNARPRKSSKSLRNTELETSAKISNDPSWYFTDPTMAEQISDFSFNQFLGVPFTLSNALPSEVNLGTIATIWLNPSAGWTIPNNPNISGINLNGVKTYSQLSSKNSKTTSYAPQDVTCLMLALGSVIEYVEWLRRIFGLAFTYNVRNRAYAKSAIEVMGINFSDFVANMADYRNRLNTVINMINQIPFPEDFSYFQKCRSMYQEVYLDSQVNMAQSYICNPYSLWQLDEQYSEAGTGLTTVVTYGAPGANTMGFHIDTLYNMIQALLTSTTLNYIYSDILSFVDKKGAKMLKLDMISSDYSVMPRYSDNFLLQLKNATILGVPLPQNLMQVQGHVTHDNDVMSDANRNAILYTPQFRYSRPIMALDHILNFKTDSPDRTMRIEATRLAARGEAFAVEGIFYTTQMTLPDHYIVQMIGYNSNNAAIFTQTDSTLGSTFGAGVAQITRFSDVPMLYTFTASGGFSTIFGDLDYFTTVDMNYLAAINDMTFMGLFGLR